MKNIKEKIYIINDNNENELYIKSQELIIKALEDMLNKYKIKHKMEKNKKNNDIEDHIDYLCELLEDHQYDEKGNSNYESIYVTYSYIKFKKNQKKIKRYVVDDFLQNDPSIETPKTTLNIVKSRIKKLKKEEIKNIEKDFLITFKKKYDDEKYFNELNEKETIIIIDFLYSYLIDNLKLEDNLYIYYKEIKINQKRKKILSQ